MAIKALFQSGNVEALTDSLYQWDYGQELEIEAVDLGTQEIEVHFACPNMTEAIVKPCYLAAGIGTVSIPDDCLEQSSTITAWIYEIVGTQGRTRKVVKIPVIARTRPSVGHDIPTEICDRYTELITAVNKALAELQSGDIVVKKATEAVTATTATSAGNASSASYAVSAGSANKATNDIDGIALKNIVHCPVDGYSLYETDIDSEETIILGGLVAFKITKSDGSDIRLITEVGGKYATNYSATFYDAVEGKSSGIHPMRLVFTHKSIGRFKITAQALIDGAWHDQTYAVYPAQIYYKHLIVYPAG